MARLKEQLRLKIHRRQKPQKYLPDSFLPPSQAAAAMAQKLSHDLHELCVLQQRLEVLQSSFKGHLQFFLQMSNAQNGHSQIG